MKRLLPLITAFLLLYLPLTVQADPKSDAIEAIGEGNTAYDSGDFLRALRQYRIAYRLTKDPRVMYRIGITYENLANFQQARHFLEMFLTEDPHSKYAGRVKKKVENLRRLEQTVQASILIRTKPSGATIFLRSETSKSLGTSPLKIPVGPGEHKFDLELDGYNNQTLTLSINSAQKLEEEVQLVKIDEVFTEKKSPVIREEPVETEIDEPSEPSESSANRLSLVNIGPSNGVNVVLWTTIGFSVFMGIVGVYGLAKADPKIPSIPLLLSGAGLFSLGGYFLWVYDWTSDLPNAVLNLPASQSLQYQVSF